MKLNTFCKQIYLQLFSYDTTFKLGDTYVSALLMRHTLFKGAPIVPVCFLLHERKYESAHEELMKYVATKCPTLANSGNETKIPIVTDEEHTICLSIDKWLRGFAGLSSHTDWTCDTLICPVSHAHTHGYDKLTHLLIDSAVLEHSHEPNVFS